MDPKTNSQIGKIVTGLRKSSVEGQLVAKSKTQYFGRELYIRCIYASAVDDEAATVYGMYDVPSILSTLHQNIYQLCGGSTEGRRDEDA